MTAPILDIHCLLPGHRQFNPEAHRKIRDTARSGAFSAGQEIAIAALVIHPFFCRPMIEQNRALFRSPELNKALQYIETDPITCYRAYLERLERSLRGSVYPIFVFTEPQQRRELERWVGSLSVKAAAIIVETPFLAHTGISPAPAFREVAISREPIICVHEWGIETSEAPEWLIFQGILNSLGINLALLMGEQYYEVEGRIEGKDDVKFRCGCVAKVRDILIHFGTRVYVGNREGAVYPNFSHSTSTDLIEFISQNKADKAISSFS